MPGFEDQLIGAKAGDERTVKVTFPENYGAAKLAGKDAEFAVKVKAVKAASAGRDRRRARQEARPRVARRRSRSACAISCKADYARASRTHLKRRILDALDEAHSFDLPPGMVDAEFDNIWRQVEAELKREGTTPEDEGKTEDELKAEYRGIAERRVRLGLVLAKIGEQNAITISQDEVNRALAARAQQFPGQEKQVFEFYTSNPQAMAEIRVPLFEDKVVDFIAELMEVKDKKVDREILFLDPDEAAEKLKEEAREAGQEGEGQGRDQGRSQGQGRTKPRRRPRPKKAEGEEKPKAKKKKE